MSFLGASKVLIFAPLICAIVGHKKEGFYRWHCNRCGKIMKDGPNWELPADHPLTPETSYRSTLSEEGGK